MKPKPSPTPEALQTLSPAEQRIRKTVEEFFGKNNSCHFQTPYLHGNSEEDWHEQRVTLNLEALPKPKEYTFLIRYHTSGSAYVFAASDSRTLSELEITETVEWKKVRQRKEFESEREHYRVNKKILNPKFRDYALEHLSTRNLVNICYENNDTVFVYDTKGELVTAIDKNASFWSVEEMVQKLSDDFRNRIAELARISIPQHKKRELRLQIERQFGTLTDQRYEKLKKIIQNRRNLNFEKN